MAKPVVTLPDSGIQILGPVPSLCYFDTQSTAVSRQITPLETWNAIMSQPQPVLRLAFKLRDAISSRFGVRRIGGFSDGPQSEVAVGDHLDFFLVEYADDETLVLTERDRHLDVMTCISTTDQRVAITSSVVTHNLFGRLYRMPVGIAHRIIVRRMLRRLERHVLGGEHR